MTQTQQVLSPETVKVGDGVTTGFGSDRYAGTITKVSASGKTVEFTNDDSRMAPEGDYFGQQVWIDTPTEPQTWDHGFGVQTNVKTARWSAKRNGFVYCGRTLGAGKHTHRDPSF